MDRSTPPVRPDSTELCPLASDHRSAQTDAPSAKADSDAQLGTVESRQASADGQYQAHLSGLGTVRGFGSAHARRSGQGMDQSAGPCRALAGKTPQETG